VAGTDASAAAATKPAASQRKGCTSLQGE
jgi:hypothetical protein